MLRLEDDWGACSLKKTGKKKAKSSSVKTTYGNLSYIDEACNSESEAILSVHGICGGYDQAYQICSPYVGKYRIIAPSRFGYPERLKGLIMYSSGVPKYPATENPEKKTKYAGPPAAFCNDFAMWLVSPLFKPLMGMDKKALTLILPMKERKAGIIFDGEVSNTVMSNYPVEYNLSKIEVPVLIIHSKDDKLAKFEKVEPWISAIKDCTFVPLENGGHMMDGNEDFVNEAVCKFIDGNK